MPVPKPTEDLPKAYLRRYWLNWQNRLYKRSVDQTVTGYCAGCGKEGVLAVDLVHRGTPRTTNLLCDDCCKDE